MGMSILSSLSRSGACVEVPLAPDVAGTDSIPIGARDRNLRRHYQRTLGDDAESSTKPVPSCLKPLWL
jgi:hypothetical protein